MSLQFAKRTQVVKLSPIREVFEMAARTPGLVRLEVGQPDFPTPRHILDAAKESLAGGHFGYSSSSGSDECRSALLKRMQEDYDISFNKDNEAVITVGASAAMYLTLRTLIDPGDEVLRPNPGWAQYDGVTNDCDGVPVLYPLEASTGFSTIDFDTLEKLVTPKTKVLILCNPNNPCGSVLDAEQLRKAYEFAVKHDIYILTDEAYSAIVYGDSFVPMLSVADDKKRIITMGSASKNYAMCGWRMGFVIANPEICSRVTVFQSLTNLCPPIISMKAFTAALSSSQEATIAMRDEYARRREFFVKALNEIKGFKCPEPQGAFYAFVDISELSDNDTEFCKKLISEVKVTCIPGSSFGSQGNGYVRFSYAASMEQLQEGVRRMKAAFGEK